VAPSENLELACLEFENYCPCYPRFLARRLPNFFRKTADHRLRFCQWHVLLKSILHGYRLRRPVRDNFILVDTAGELVQAQTIAAEILFEGG